MTRKKIKAISVIFILLIISIACIINFQKKETQPLKKIPSIDYPKMAGEESNDYNFTVVNNINNEQLKEISEDEKLDVVYIVNNDTDQEVVSNICKSVQAEEIIAENEDFVSYGDDKNLLTVFSDSSIFYQQEGALDDEIVLSNDECKKIAEQFIKDNDLEKYNFKLYSIDNTYSNDIDNPSKKKIISKQMVFTRTIYGESVYGESQLILSLTNDGEVSQLFLNINKIEEECIVENTVSVVDAIDMISKNEGYIDVPDKTKSVEIENVEIKHWEEKSIDNNITSIQPVYEFTGKAFDEDNNYLGTVTIVESVLE